MSLQFLVDTKFTKTSQLKFCVELQLGMNSLHALSKLFCLILCMHTLPKCDGHVVFAAACRDVNNTVQTIANTNNSTLYC